MSNLFQLKDLKEFEILEVKQFENKARDRPEFDNKFLKILYFFMREGIFPTLKKFYAHRRKQQRFLTFVFSQLGDKTYLNISVQSQTNPPDFVVLNEFYEWPGDNFEYPDPNNRSHKSLEN